MALSQTTPAYAEAAPAHVPGIVVCTWTRAVGPRPARTTITPDGCADVIVQPDGRIIVAGPDTGPHVTALGGGVFVGLRFHIGAAGAALGIAASALRDQRVPIEDVWRSDANRLADRLSDAPTIDARRGVLEEAVAERVQRGAVDEDRLVLAAVALLRRRAQPVAALASHLGVSERQLLRRFDAAVGYGPKTLDRVLRFRRVLRALDAPPAALGAVAMDAGYADQAHMTRECARLAGATPRALLASKLVLAASE